MRWVFEWADTHLEREWVHEHGDVSVARERQSDQRCDECDVRCAEWFERGDVRVHVDGHMRQLQCDVEQCDGDGESRAERDDQCEWFDESVRWVFERADAHLEREWMHEHGDVSVARERQPDQWCDEMRAYVVPGGLSAGTYVYTIDCHMRQLQCDVEQCDSDGESLAERDDQLLLESERDILYTDEHRTWNQCW